MGNDNGYNEKLDAAGIKARINIMDNDKIKLQEPP